AVEQAEGLVPRGRRRERGPRELGGRGGALRGAHGRGAEQGLARVAGAAGAQQQGDGEEERLLVEGLPPHGAAVRLGDGRPREVQPGRRVLAEGPGGAELVRGRHRDALGAPVEEPGEARGAAGRAHEQAREQARVALDAQERRRRGAPVAARRLGEDEGGHAEAHRRAVKVVRPGLHHGGQGGRVRRRQLGEVVVALVH
ncbi:hypothetical protein EG861_14380, partial [Enterococcus faecalis]